MNHSSQRGVRMLRCCTSSATAAYKPDQGGRGWIESQNTEQHGKREDCLRHHIEAVFAAVIPDRTGSCLLFSNLLIRKVTCLISNLSRSLYLSIHAGV